MLRWLRFSRARILASVGLVLTLIGLVAATTAVISGTVGYTAASATAAARSSVAGEERLGVSIQIRVADDPERQDQLAQQTIRETFAPAPVTIERSVSQDESVPYAIWRVLPDVDRMEPHHLPYYADGAERVRMALRNSEASQHGVTLEGDLAEAAGIAARNLAVSEALGLIPLSVLILVTTLAVIQVARLLSTSRETQVSLLISRGANRAQVFLIGAAESLISVTIGVVTGALLAWLVLRSVPFGASQGPAVVRTALLCFAGTLAIVLALLAGQVRTLAQPGHVVDRSGRSSRAVAGTTLVIVLLGAVVAVWQLARTGSPLVFDGEDYSVNLIAGAAPALLLAAAGVIALGLLGPVSAIGAALARLGRGAAAFLTATQVSRQIRVYAVPVMLTVMATGAATIAGTYAGTSAQLRDSMQALTQGAPIRAAVERAPAWTTAGEVPPPPVPQTPGVQSSALVWDSDAGQIGNLGLSVVGAVPDALNEVALVPESTTLIPESFLATPDEALAGTGLVLSPGTTHVDAGLTAEVTVDQWGIAHMDLTAGISRQVARSLGGMTPSQIEEQAANDVASQVDTARAALPLDVRLYIRDLATGMGQFVSMGTQMIDGPDVTYNTDTLTDHQVTPAISELQWRMELDPQRQFVIDAISIDLPGTDPQFRTWSRQLEIALTLEDSDGNPLLGESTASWASMEAAEWSESEELMQRRAETPAEVVVSVEAQIGGGVSTSFESNEFYFRTALDTSDETWRVFAREASTEFWGSSISPAFQPATTDGPAGSGPHPGSSVAVALTPATAEDALLSVGDEFQLLFMNQQLPARLVELIDAAPGRTDPYAGFVDVRSVGASLAGSGQESRYPTQLWATPASDLATSAAQLGEVEQISSVSVAEQEAPTDPTRSARLVFWVACVGAFLLASTGIAAAAVTMTGYRRSEVAVLRALGMAPTRQASSRASELGVVVLASVGIGLVSGQLISIVVVPALAQSTNAPGLVELNPRVILELAPWLALLAFGGILVAAIIGYIARTVRKQALDRTYREEVR